MQELQDDMAHARGKAGKMNERTNKALNVTVLTLFAVLCLTYILSQKSPITGYITYGPGGCVYPEAGLQVNESMTFCAGVYNLTDPGGGTILISASNVALDCNGATINGDDAAESYGIKDESSGRINVTIRNCTIKNYDTGISFYNSRNVTIANNNITDNGYGILLSSSYTETYGYTSIIGNSISRSGQASVYLEGGSRHNISNNIIRDGLTFGIDLVRVNKSHIHNNTIYNHTSESSGGIRVCANNCYYNVVDSNNISSSGWNCIDGEGYYGNYSSNAISSCAHSAIDICGGTHNTVSSGYNNIFNNTIRDSGLYICIGVFNRVYNNSIIDILPNNVNSSFGIGIEGNTSETRGNTFYDNIIRNVTGDCIYTASTDSSWENNSLSLCNTSTVRISNWWEDTSQVNNDSFRNNIYPEGYANFIPDNSGPMNYTLFENSSGFHRIRLSSNKYIIFNYSGTKNFRVSGNTIYLYNQADSFPYNDVYNTTSSALVASNTDNYNFNIASGQTITIGNFTSKNQSNSAPAISGLAINSSDGMNITTSDLNCFATLTDANDDRMNVSTQWYRNSTLMLQKDYNSSYASGTAFVGTLIDADILPVLLTDNLTAGDVWSCGMRLHDGEDYSSWSNSSSLTIAEDVNVAPSVSVSLSASGTLLNCSLTATDADNDMLNTSIKWYRNEILNTTTDFNNSYASGTGISETKSGLEGETWICSARAHDGYNYSSWQNSSGTTITVPVQNGGSGSGGGGGGGGGITTPTQQSDNKTNATLKPGDMILQEVSDVDVAMTEVNVELSNEVSEANIRVSRLREKPSVLQSPTETVYQYIDVRHDNIGDRDIASVKHKFRVEKSWLEQNAAEKNEIFMYRYANNDWQELKTDEVREDEVYVYYEAESSGLSIFAIAVKRAKMPVDEPISIEQPSELPVQEAENASSTWLPYVLGLFVLIGAFGIYSVRGKPVEIPLGAPQEEVNRFALKALKAGYTYEAVRHALRMKGYHKNAVDAIMHNLKASHVRPEFAKYDMTGLDEDMRKHMVERLSSYIGQMRSKGFREVDVERNLKKHGYERKLIREARKAK